MAEEELAEGAGGGDRPGDDGAGYNGGDGGNGGAGAGGSEGAGGGDELAAAIELAGVIKRAAAKELVAAATELATTEADGEKLMTTALAATSELAASLAPVPPGRRHPAQPPHPGCASGVGREEEEEEGRRRRSSPDPSRIIRLQALALFFQKVVQRIMSE